MDSSEINYGSLFRRADEVLSGTGELEEELREKAAGYFEPGGHKSFPRYIGEEVGIDKLQEAAERTAEQLNSIYHLQIVTSDLVEEVSSGEEYQFHGHSIRGTSLKRRLRDLHKRITEEEEGLIELAERLERDEKVPVQPISMSADYGIEDLRMPD